MARSGPYDQDDDVALKALADRVEAIVSHENAKWFASQQKANQELLKK
jgi:hypothetical protein